VISGFVKVTLKYDVRDKKDKISEKISFIPARRDVPGAVSASQAAEIDLDVGSSGPSGQ
jgi:hypothetical protein